MRTGHANCPRWRRQCAIVAVSFLMPGAASAGYVGINLYALGPVVGSQYVNLAVSSSPAAGGQVAGIGGPMYEHAVLWTPTLSNDTVLNSSGITAVRAADINPPGYDSSRLWSTNGTQQAGYATIFQTPFHAGGQFAMLWNGSASSAINLNPTKFHFTTSSLTATDGTNQVGVGYGTPTISTSSHALLWSGTADSAVDLNPSHIYWAEPLGVGGNQQVGQAYFPVDIRNLHAALWSGTAASIVDLNPPGFTSSAAMGVAANQQVGMGIVPNQQAGYSNEHPLLWRGTAASVVDLLPGGYTDGGAIGTNGAQQVGFATPTTTGASSRHAIVWSGSAASALDLQPLLPFYITGSVANSIDAAGNIFGIGYDSFNDYYAVEWLPHPPLAGDANLDGKVDFSDLLALARSYGQYGGWIQGEFDGDGKVDFKDLLILARNYGQTLTTAQLSQFDLAFRADIERAFADVPEPKAVAPFLISTFVLAMRRKRNLRVLHRPWFWSVWRQLLVVAACGPCAIASGSTRYNVVVLRTDADVHGIAMGQVVGQVQEGVNATHAFLWNGPSMGGTDLNPTGYDSSAVLATSGDQQVGVGRPSGVNSDHALLWNGSSTGVVDLNPVGSSLGSSAYGVWNNFQVGLVGAAVEGSVPVVWHGNAKSMMTLPHSGYLNSGALGISNGQIIGDGFLGSTSHPLLWLSSTAAPLDLAPTSGNYVWAGAVGIGGEQQVGHAEVAGIPMGFPPVSNDTTHAVLWTGSAASMVDLHPTTLPGAVNSWATATNGEQQVGYITGQQPDVGFTEQAVVWDGSAASVQLLPLPSGYVASIPSGIDAQGDIAGVAIKPGPGAGHEIDAVEWLPVPEPQSILLPLAAAFMLPRRSRNSHKLLTCPS